MHVNSKSQQRFMGMVHQCKKTGKCVSASVQKAADSMKNKDAKDFTSTKHKGLPNKISEKMTFKEFLLEIDIGDHQIHQEYNAKQAEIAANNKFRNRMNTESPNSGDIIISSKGRFVVLGGSMDGLKVKQLGGNGDGVFPHGTKYKNVGQGKSGKIQWEVVSNA